MPATLVCIDWQHGAIGSSEEKNISDAFEAGRRLLSAWRECGAPIIHVKTTSDDDSSPMHRNNVGYASIAGLDAHPGETVIDKFGGGAFVRSGLADELARLGGPVVLCGLGGNLDVSSTARGAADHGNKIYVCWEAIFCSPCKDWETGELLLDCDTVKRAAMNDLHGTYATVAHEAEILKVLWRDSVPPPPPKCATQMPDGWSPVFDANSGHYYYYNSITGESRWTFPRRPSARPSLAVPLSEIPPPPPRPVAWETAADEEDDDGDDRVRAKSRAFDEEFSKKQAEIDRMLKEVKREPSEEDKKAAERAARLAKLNNTLL